MAPAIRFSRVTKRYPGVVALRDVSFDVDAGTCHAVCGENGAGKSSLAKILAGIEQPDSGTILLDGREVRFSDPSAALEAGVAMVHQELAFCENMSVAENLCLGRMPSRGLFISRARMRARARELLATVEVSIDVDREMSTLSVAEQQLVQIAAAAGSGARIIIFDEPTSSLSEGEASGLYALVHQLTSRGVTLVYVSHRMPEIFRLASRVTVLRDGTHVETRATASLDERELVRLMIGRDIDQYFPAHVNAVPGEELLRTEALSHRGGFEDISFTLRAGEIVGLAGLVGAGRSELARALFGLEAGVTGRIFVHGQPVQIRSARDAMRLGLALVPEDRKHQGLVLSMLARENVTLPLLAGPRLSRSTFVRRAAEGELAQEHCRRLSLRAPNLEVVASSLSGGNQQKLVLARWLAAGSRVLLLDEPTRGVDVGAKAELHARIDQLASDGHGIVLISSELPELLNLSTRILVLRRGRIVGEVGRNEATQERLLRLMAGLEFSPPGRPPQPTAA